MSALSRALGAIDPVRGARSASRSRPASPTSLARLGMPRDGIVRVVDAMLAAPQLRPRALDRESAHRDARSGATSSRSRPLRRRRCALPSRSRPSPGSAERTTRRRCPARSRGGRTRRACARTGSIPELVNGTPFTVRSAENSRVWLYRVRASFSHGELAELSPGRVPLAARRREPEPDAMAPDADPRGPFARRLPRRPRDARRRGRSDERSRVPRPPVRGERRHERSRVLERGRGSAHRAADRNARAVARSSGGCACRRARSRSSRAGSSSRSASRRARSDAAGCSRSSAGACACPSAG